MTGVPGVHWPLIDTSTKVSTGPEEGYTLTSRCGVAVGVAVGVSVTVLPVDTVGVGVGVLLGVPMGVDVLTVWVGVAVLPGNVGVQVGVGELTGSPGCEGV